MGAERRWNDMFILKNEGWEEEYGKEILVKKNSE